MKKFIRKIKRVYRRFVYVRDWMPYGWNPSDMTEEFWNGY